MMRFGSGTERDVNQHLRNADLDRDFPPAQRPLAFFQIVRQHLVSGIFQRCQHGVAHKLR